MNKITINLRASAWRTSSYSDESAATNGHGYEGDDQPPGSRGLHDRDLTLA